MVASGHAQCQAHQILGGAAPGPFLIFFLYIFALLCETFYVSGSEAWKRIGFPECREGKFEVFLSTTSYGWICNGQLHVGKIILFFASGLVFSRKAYFCYSFYIKM